MMQAPSCRVIHLVTCLGSVLPRNWDRIIETKISYRVTGHFLVRTASVYSIKTVTYQDCQCDK